jgi:hypothetical protein
MVVFMIPVAVMTTVAAFSVMGGMMVVAVLDMMTGVVL